MIAEGSLRDKLRGTLAVREVHKGLRRFVRDKANWASGRP